MSDTTLGVLLIVAAILIWPIRFVVGDMMHNRRKRLESEARH